jgi:uncharacterized protein Yka (UPF0111/DUF47 family)
MSLLRRYFLREAPDVLGLLRRQGEITLRGMEDFERWCVDGDEAQALAVRDAEHAADAARLDVLRALSAALTTTVDQEDLYTLSERLDTVLNEAKNAVRESEVLGIPPDENTAAMGTLSLEATQHLVAGLDALGEKSEHPGDHADAAVKAARRIDRAYRDAIANLPKDVDPRTQIQTIELYRSYTQIAEAVVHVATRTWYALLKGG